MVLVDGWMVPDQGKRGGMNGWLGWLGWQRGRG